MSIKCLSLDCIFNFLFPLELVILDWLFFYHEQMQIIYSTPELKNVNMHAHLDSEAFHLCSAITVALFGVPGMFTGL